MSLRVAVTGSSGFIGRHVLVALAARGHVAFPVRHPFTAATLAPVFRSCDAVVNLAGVVSAVRDDAFVSGNVRSAEAVAHAARDAGVRLVHVSTLAAAGPAPASAPRSEDDPAAPTTIYGRTKLAGEAAVRSADGLRWIILRPGVVYGPGDRALRPLFRYAARGVLPLVGNAGAAYTFVYIDDAVAAIVAAVESDAAGDTLFVGHEAPVAPRALLEAIAATLGVRVRIVPLPRGVVRVAAMAGEIAGRVTGRPAAINMRRFVELYSPGFVCRVDRLREDLGVEAKVGLADGLGAAASWYRSQV